MINYKVALDQQMIQKAIKNDMKDFVYYIFAYNKNYFRVKNYVGEEGESEETSDGV